MLKYFLFPFLLFCIVACSGDEQATKSPEPVSTTQVSSAQHAKYKLVFFLNPNGGPCRAQNSILSGMAQELSGKLDIQYVQTTVPSDLNIFSSYGIRSLPLLLLADGNGKEIQRLPPGIRSADDIRHLLQSIPSS